MAAWFVLLTIGIPWLGGLCVWLLGDKHPRYQHMLASIFAVTGGIISLGLIPFVDEGVVLSIPMGGVFGNFTFVSDGLGVYLAIIAAVIGSLTVIFSNAYMQDEDQLGRYYALTLLFIGAMAGLVLSGSLLLMFIFWEITAFCSYALIAFHNDDPKAVAGGIKALIMTQIGGVGLLVGALVAYVFFGDYQIQIFLEQASTLPPNLLALTAFSFLVAAAAKSAQVPFHTWLPDAMEAPTPISALIHAATMVNAGVYLLARFYPAFSPVSGWAISVMCVGLISALLAAITAVVCDDLKRTLAYSTISQLGYMVYAIGVGGITPSQFHLFSHSLFKALLFLGAGAVIHTVGTRNMFQMGNLQEKMPFARTVFVVGALALAGLPITNGFFSKELVLESGVLHGPVWAYLAMLVGAGITGLYSVRMVSLVFYGTERGAGASHDAGTMMRIPLAILAFGTLTSWILVGPFSQMLAESLPYHQLHATETLELVSEILTAPTTWLAVFIVLAGCGLWFMRNRLVYLVKALQPLGKFLLDGAGFEWINQQIIQITKDSASALRITQTGILSWNVLGIVIGLLVVLALLVGGA